MQDLSVCLPVYWETEVFLLIHEKEHSHVVDKEIDPTRDHYSKRFKSVSKRNVVCFLLFVVPEETQKPTGTYNMKTEFNCLGDKED